MGHHTGVKNRIHVTKGPTVQVSTKSAYHGPDQQIVAFQLAKLQDMAKAYGPALFDSRMCWILRKNPEKGEKDLIDLLAQNSKHWNRRLIPFRHNLIQQDLDKKMTARNIMLKPRQGGYTTYNIIRRLFIPAILEPGTGGMLISQNYKYVAQHFGILQRVFKYFAIQDPFAKDYQRKNWIRMGHPDDPELHGLTQHLLHTSYTNRRELVFDAIDSRIICESAENEEAGQGVTIQHLVCSEVARWPGNPEETLANVKEGLPLDGTLDLESTANMQGNYFHDECIRSSDPGNKGKVEFTFHFHPWWFHEEYRMKPPIDPATMSEEEEQLRKQWKLDFEQLAWRRKKMISLRHNFPEKYPEDPVTCFLVQGNTFFDKDILALRYRELMTEKPYDKAKKVTIYKQRLKHHRYVIGADPAQGYVKNNPDPDFSAAVVLDLENGEQVASYRARLTEEEFAWDLAELGRLYNNALIAVERMGYGGTTIVTLEVACQYTNLYKHKDWWKRDKMKAMEFHGFPTSPRTRPLALNRLRFFIHETPEHVHDLQMVSECLSFTYNEQGKPEASGKAHDDTVMANAIGHYCRAVLLGHLDPLSVPSEKYGRTPGEFAEDEEFEGPSQ